MKELRVAIVLSFTVAGYLCWAAPRSTYWRNTLFPPAYLAALTGFSGFINIVCHGEKKQRRILSIVGAQLACSAALTVLYVLLGRSPTATLREIPLTVLCGTTVGPALLSPMTFVEGWRHFVKSPAFAPAVALLAAAASSICILFDWQTQWIVWPTPAVIGFVGGYVAASVLQVFYITAQKRTHLE